MASSNVMRAGALAGVSGAVAGAVGGGRGGIFWFCAKAQTGSANKAMAARIEPVLMAETPDVSVKRRDAEAKEAKWLTRRRVRSGEPGERTYSAGGAREGVLRWS